MNFPLIFTAAALALALAGISPRAAAAEKPNIVMILIDDLGYGDIGPFGATGQRTPNLDRMAAEGMKLTSFYGAPACSVSRAQFLTGCYGARVSVPAVFSPGSDVGLNPAERTVAEHLKDAGYATACVGKWHVGDQPEFLPTRQGFDRYFGLPYSNDMQRMPEGGAELVVPLMRDERVEELLPDERQTCLVGRYTEEAVGFIRENKDRPFFLYLPHSAVHVPIYPGPDFAGKSANGRFGDWVEEVDGSVGRVLDTLRELGLETKTLVVFSSDNGPWLVKGADAGNAGPLRGAKGSTWEGGVRVPTLAWWPGKIPAGKTCDQIAGNIDLLPTFVRLAGGTVPPEPAIDGKDISGMLFGGSGPAREAHFYFAGYKLAAVRKGPWKLALMPQPQATSKERAPDTLKNPRLYNLDEEIGEVTDRSAENPEIVAALQALAAGIDAEIGGESPGARRPPGVSENPRTIYPIEPRGPKQGGETGGNRSPDLGHLRVGDALAGDEAPFVAGRPFTYSCTVQSGGADGVIFAHGGATFGYALHLRGGRVVFSVRNKGEFEIESEGLVPGEPTGVSVSLGREGEATLRVGDAREVTARFGGIMARQPHEDFCVGFDGELPVAAYPAKGIFAGTVAGLKFSSP